MKHLAEQFRFDFDKVFLLGDKVVVKTDDATHLEVYTIIDLASATGFLELENSKGIKRMALAKNCRIAKDIDYL